MSSSGIYIPVKASKGKEQTRMLLPPIPAPRARPRCSILSLPTLLILFLIIYVFSWAAIKCSFVKGLTHSITPQNLYLQQNDVSEWFRIKLMWHGLFINMAAGLLGSKGWFSGLDVCKPMGSALVFLSYCRETDKIILQSTSTYGLDHQREKYL